jgi:hypothetical protein
MPFGKHRGTPLEKVPEDYLRWVLDHCENVGPTLRRGIEQRLGLGLSKAVNDVVATWYRKLSLEFHPDLRSGSHAAMVAVNRARELLQELLGGAA